MPATGVRAPERILVAVRAMAPVTGMPPNSGLAILANPLGHQFGVGVVAVAAHRIRHYCRKQASAARMATVSAEGNSGRIRSARNCGIWIGGSARLMPPNLLPMVSTGN